MSKDKDICLTTPHGKFNYRVVYLLFRNDKVMLQDSANGAHNWWYTPGGRVKFGEDSQSALKRELEEETGITDDLDFKFTGTIENFFHMDGKDYHEMMMVYAAELDRDITLPDHDELGEPLPHGWFTQDEVKELYLLPSFFKTRLFEFRHGFTQIIHYDKN